MRFLTTVAALLVTAPLALAQTPVQTIKLADKEMLDGAIRLTSGNTVIFLTNSTPNNGDVHAVALRPDGTTLWDAKLLKVQQLTSSRTKPFMESGSSRQSREALNSMLQPVNIYSSGNDVYAVEVMDKEAVRHAGKNATLKANQIIVQHIAEDGEVSKAIFDGPDPGKKVEREEIGHYGDGDTYYVVAEEVNPREETTVQVMDCFNLTTKTTKHITLPLAPCEGRKGIGRVYNHWRYLGHRPNQTYFVRNVFSHSKDEVPFRRYTLDYEVVVVNNAGEKVSGFVKMLDLPAENFVSYSGYMPNLLEQMHPYDAWGSGSYAVDAFRINSGGYGDMYLEYATGNVLIFGEYAKVKPGSNHFNGVPLKGFFAFRFDPTGQVLNKAVVPYPADMLKKRADDFEGSLKRYCYFDVEPITGNLEFGFITPHMAGKNFFYRQVLDKNLNDLGVMADEVPKSNLSDYFDSSNGLTLVSPMCAEKPRGQDHETRTFGPYPPKAQSPALYAQLKKLKARKDDNDKEVRTMYLSAGADGKALVVFHPQILGGDVKVYTF